jgi:hypothetical protein
MISSSSLSGGTMDLNKNKSNATNFTSNLACGGSRLEDDYTGPIQRRRRCYDLHHGGTASSSVRNTLPNTTDESISGSASTITTPDEADEERESLTSDHTGNNSSNSDDAISDELARELYQLSMHERQRMLHDVHCVPDLIDDSPATEGKALKDLDAWIKEHRDTDEAAAYRTAESISADYVNSRELRMAYLRGVMDYNIARAGPRFFLFFEFKLEYFGRDKLTQKLTLDDLDADDMECLKTGFLQILPVRDPGERPIMFFNFHAMKYATLANAVSAFHIFLYFLYSCFNAT